jgi:hypothetical protein
MKKAFLSFGLVILPILSSVAQSVPQSSEDLWNYDQGITITGTSGFLWAGTPYGMFGLNGHSNLSEAEWTYFSDGMPDGFTHFVEWSTKTPVTLEAIRLFAAGDGEIYLNEREFDQFVLKAKSLGSSEYDTTILTYTPPHPYTFLDFSNYAILDSAVTPVTAQEFRAEFVQFTAGRGFDGPRIVELDGFGTVPPFAPIIKTQPASAVVNVGTPVIFSVSADGTEPISYQWQRNGVDVPGATASSLRIDNVRPEAAGEYIVKVSNTIGTSFSEAAQLSIELNSILASSFDAWNFTSGSVITASSGYLWAGTPYGMFGENGHSNLSEAEWTYFNDGMPDGFTHFVEWSTPTPVAIRSIRLFAAGDGPIYNNEREFTQFVLRTKSAGSSEFDVVLADFTPQHPFLLLAPATYALLDTQVALTTAQEFRAEFVQFNGFRGFDGPRIVELDGFSTIPEVLPAIISSPASQTVVHHSSLTLSVQAKGGNLHYQWKFNGANIPGATADSFTITKVKPRDQGNYSVLVSNSLGSSETAPAFLTVLPGQPGE